MALSHNFVYKTELQIIDMNQLEGSLELCGRKPAVYDLSIILTIPPPQNRTYSPASQKSLV